jgi:hypothetical protein
MSAGGGNHCLERGTPKNCACAAASSGIRACFVFWRILAHQAFISERSSVSDHGVWAWVKDIEGQRHPRKTERVVMVLREMLLEMGFHGKGSIVHTGRVSTAANPSHRGLI